MVNVVCMKWGRPYGPEYVNRLYRGVARNLSLPFRFICFTDDPTDIEPPVECKPLPPIDLPSGYEHSAFRKISLFAPELDDLTGRTLFLDLDVVIVDAIDCFFSYEARFCIIHNWIEWRKTIVRKRPQIGNSSVFRFEIGDQVQAWEDFHADPMRAMTGHPTEQAYMTSVVEGLVFWPEEWCRSFKRHCIPTPPLNLFVEPQLPVGARIIAFHGLPNPPEAAAGFRANWRKRTLPARWIIRHWN